MSLRMVLLRPGKNWRLTSEPVSKRVLASSAEYGAILLPSVAFVDRFFGGLLAWQYFVRDNKRLSIRRVRPLLTLFSSTCVIVICLLWWRYWCSVDAACDKQKGGYDGFILHDDI